MIKILVESSLLKSKYLWTPKLTIYIYVDYLPVCHFVLFQITVWSLPPTSLSCFSAACTLPCKSLWSLIKSPFSAGVVWLPPKTPEEKMSESSEAKEGKFWNWLDLNPCIQRVIASLAFVLLKPARLVILFPTSFAPREVLVSQFFSYIMFLGYFNVPTLTLAVNPFLKLQLFSNTYLIIVSQLHKSGWPLDDSQRIQKNPPNSFLPVNG